MVHIVRALASDAGRAVPWIELSDGKHGQEARDGPGAK
jgi:hypothetical protein